MSHYEKPAPAIVKSRLLKNKGKTLCELGWRPKAGLTSITRLGKWASKYNKHLFLWNDNA